MSSPEMRTSTGLLLLTSSCFQRTHPWGNAPANLDWLSRSTATVAFSSMVLTSNCPKLRSGMWGAYTE